MAKAKDKTTKRKRTLTAKAAAAAPTVAPARAGKKPKKQSAKPTGAAQLPVETQETATLDHIVWDPPETTDTGSQDVDTWDMSDLARAALALPEEFKAEVDAAWNAADTAKALRDILRRHAEASDEFTGLPLCDLARRAATLPETLRGQVDAAFGSNNIEEALRQILRAASSSATQVAAEADSEEADSEEDDTSDKDDAMASLNAMMASELRKASASATPAARAAHQATAQMIQVQIQAGGEKDGKGGKPRKAKSPSQMEFSMSKLEDALKAQDTVMVNRLLHSQTLDLENGQSQAMRELNAASLLAGEQGGSNQRYVPLVSRPPVAAPGAGFEGQRPLVDMDRLTKHNVLLPRWFHVGDEKLDSDLLSAPCGTGLEEPGSVGTAVAPTLGTFTKPSEWFRASVLLQQFAQQTVPALLTPIQCANHMTYAIDIEREMMVEGADQIQEVMHIFVRYDEKVRLHIASANDELEFTDHFPHLEATYKDLPLKVLARQRASGGGQQKRLAARRLEWGRDEKADSRRETDKAKDGKGGHRFLKSLGPDVVDKWLEIKGKGACGKFNKEVGCTRGDKCRFSHHCLICGDTSHGMADHKSG